MASMAPGASTAQQAPGFGRIEGKVIDARCGTAVPYASVIIVGTKLGVMSLRDGAFSIVCVPPGTYTLRVLAMSYDTVEVTGLAVEGGATVQQNLALQRGQRNNRTIDARAGPETCEVHGLEMMSVLVPIAYGLGVIDPKAVREARFPYGDLRHDGGCVVGEESPWKAMVLRCPECVVARNRHDGSDVWDRTTTGRRDLQTHTFADAVEFSVPPDGEMENVIEACRQVSILRTDSATVRIVKCDWSLAQDEYPRAVDYSASVIQAGVAAWVGVVESADSMDVYVRFLVTPLDADAIIMKIQVRGPGGLSLAAAIARSIRFLAS